MDVWVIFFRNYISGKLSSDIYQVAAKEFLKHISELLVIGQDQVFHTHC